MGRLIHNLKTGKENQTLPFQGGTRNMTTKISKYMLAAMAALVTLMATSAAYAQAASPEVAKAENARWYALAAALGLGIAAFGGALGQGRAAAAALDGIARNPGASDKLFTPMILGLALIESLVIYSLLIAFLLYGKIG
jgi:F-type H+-transporting ATPase subunit c